MAFGSFAPMYIDSMRVFGKDSFGFRLMWELGAHSDMLGMSYPGHAHLANMCYRSRESIHTKLIELSEMDYIRCHLTVHPHRARPAITYQVSPYVLFIRDELMPEAVRLWDEGKPYLEIHNVINVQQPANNQGNQYQNQFENQFQNQTIPENGKSQNPKTDVLQSHQKHELSKQKKHANGGQLANALVHSANHANGATHGVAVQQNPPPNSAPPPPVDAPLPDAECELVAQMLRVFGGGTNIKVARALVHEHGVVRVRDAMQKARVKATANPIGYVRNMLKTSQQENPPVTPEQIAKLEADLELAHKWRARDALQKTDDGTAF